MTKNDFRPVTGAIVEKLKGIVGPKWVIAGDREALEPYSHDETAEKKYAAMQSG